MRKLTADQVTYRDAKPIANTDQGSEGRIRIIAVLENLVVTPAYLDEIAGTFLGQTQAKAFLAQPELESFLVHIHHKTLAVFTGDNHLF